MPSRLRTLRHRLSSGPWRSTGSGINLIDPDLLAHRPASASEGSQDVTVHADELALGDLLEDLLAARAHRADVSPLRRTGKVIPLHRLRRVLGSTVSAGLSDLQRTDPLARCVVAVRRDAASRWIASEVPLAVEGRAAALANGLATVAARAVEVKLSQLPVLAAARTPLHLDIVQAFETINNSGNDMPERSKRR